MIKGAAGFVLPFKENIVYVEIDEGDDFGQVDIIAQCLDEDIDVITLFRNKLSLKRQFTV